MRYGNRMGGRIAKVKGLDEDGLLVDVTIADLARMILIPRGFGRFMPAYTEGPPGPGGKTAYQLAVDGGYAGTLAQWLAAQVGAAGMASTVRNASSTLTAFALLESTRDVDIVWTNPDTGVAAPFPDTNYSVLPPAIVATGIAIGAVSASFKPGTKTMSGCTITVRTTGIAVAAGQILTVAAIR